MDLRGKKILLTGDSHMDWSKWGKSLQELLENEGAIVTRLAIGGSNLRQWLNDKEVCRKLYPGFIKADQTYSGRGSERGKKCITLSDLKAKGPYDLVIISSYGNDIAEAYLQYPRYYKNYTPEVYIGRVKKLVSEVGAPNFLLYTPGRTSGNPLGSPDPADPSADFRGQPYSKAARKAFGDSFFESRKIADEAWDPKTGMMKKGEGDNVHYLGPTAVKLAEATVAWIKDHDLRVNFDSSGAETQDSGGSSFGLIAGITAVALGAAWLLSRRSRG